MEDDHDLAVVAERREESNLTFSELKKKLSERLSSKEWVEHNEV